MEQVARLKEEVRNGESRRTQLEHELRRLHDEHSDMVKKLSHAEASLQMTARVSRDCDSNSDNDSLLFYRINKSQ